MLTDYSIIWAPILTTVHDGFPSDQQSMIQLELKYSPNPFSMSGYDTKSFLSWVFKRITRLIFCQFVSVL